jgi:hypothetical protein
MSRSRFYRKRPGYREWVADLWRALLPFMETASPDAPRSDTAGLTGLSSRQTAELRAILAELGEVFRIGLAVNRLPDAPPPFFATGAEIPVPRLGKPSPRLQGFLEPQGRRRKSEPRPLRPQQTVVDAWMLGRAELAFARGEPALKEAPTVAECMSRINASRQQGRVAYARLPLTLRRQRGENDRWRLHRAPAPDV